MREAYARKSTDLCVKFGKTGKNSLEQTLKSKDANEQESKINF